MSESYLSPEEKAHALHLLSRSSWIGGWTLLFLISGIPFLALLAVAFNLIPVSENWTSQDTGLFIFWIVAGAVPSIWMLRQKKKIATELEAPVQTVTAVITHITVQPYAGAFVELAWGTPADPTIGRIRYIVKPDLAIGQSLKLRLLPNGRFFPADLTQAVDLGRLDTPERRGRRRLWTGAAVFIFLLLVTFGFLIGFLSDR